MISTGLACVGSTLAVPNQPYTFHQLSSSVMGGAPIPCFLAPPETVAPSTSISGRWQWLKVNFGDCRHSVRLECLGKSIVQYLRVLVVKAVSIKVQHAVVGERSVNITKIVGLFKFIKHGWLYF